NLRGNSLPASPHDIRSLKQIDALGNGVLRNDDAAALRTLRRDEAPHNRERGRQKGKEADRNSPEVDPHRTWPARHPRLFVAGVGWNLNKSSARELDSERNVLVWADV